MKRKQCRTFCQWREAVMLPRECEYPDCLYVDDVDETYEPSQGMGGNTKRGKPDNDCKSDD